MKLQRTFLVLLLGLTMVFGLAGCQATPSVTPNDATAQDTKSETPVEDATEKAEETFSVPDGSVAERYPMLTNLTLDGTLTPDMYKGQKVVVASGGGDFEKSLKEYAAIFNELTGGEIEVQSFPDQLFEKAQLALSSGGQFDVIVMPIAFIHSFAYAGYIADLTDPLATKASPNYDVIDFIPGLYNTYANYDGKTVALPFKPDSQMFFYRKDLFEDANVMAAFKEKVGRDLTVPTTPEELLEVAQFFTKSLNPDSPVDYGFSTMMAKGSSRFSWFNRLGYYGGTEIKADFTPGFTDGSGEKALQFMLDLGETAPSDWVTFDWDTANTFFAQGNAAMMEQWPGLYLTCNQESSPTKGKIGYGVVPGNSPTLGGWAMGIAADSTELDMAFKFCEMVTSKDGEYIKVQYTMDPCRTSNYSRDIFEEISDPEMNKALMANLAVATQLADTDVPYVAAQIGDIEEAAIQSALTGEFTAAQAMAEIAEQMQQTIDGVKDQLR